MPELKSIILFQLVCVRLLVDFMLIPVADIIRVSIRRNRLKVRNNAKLQMKPLWN